MSWREWLRVIDDLGGEWREGWMDAGGVCVCVCVSLWFFSAIAAAERRKRIFTEPNSLID